MFFFHYSIKYEILPFSIQPDNCPDIWYLARQITSYPVSNRISQSVSGKPYIRYPAYHQSCISCQFHIIHHSLMIKEKLQLLYKDVLSQDMLKALSKLNSISSLLLRNQNFQIIDNQKRSQKLSQGVIVFCLRRKGQTYFFFGGGGSDHCHIPLLSVTYLFNMIFCMF